MKQTRKIQIHGMMADYDKSGRVVGMLSIVELDGGFEIWTEDSRSVCGRHATKEAAIHASSSYDCEKGVMVAG